MQRIGPDDVESVEPTEDIVVTLLGAGERMNVQHVRFGPGTVGSEHSHPHEQIVYVTAGSLVYHGPDGEVRLEAGDSLVIPGDEPHAAANPGSEPADVIEVFSPRRDDPPWAE